MDFFNNDLKEKALKRLSKAEKRYNWQVDELNSATLALFELRRDTVTTCIKQCEDLLSRIAQAPKELSSEVSELKLTRKRFVLPKIVSKDAQDVDSNVVSTTVKAAAGVGVAAVAPPVAMLVATTFGTASTGVAISTLSGAAATNAALAWLGGGTLAAGGGGMAAGGAILGLAGPIGWGIGLGAIAIGGYKYATNNDQVAKEATIASNELNEQSAKLAKFDVAINKLMELTRDHKVLLEKQIETIKDFPESYKSYDDNQKKCLGSFINNVHSLIEMVDKKVG